MERTPTSAVVLAVAVAHTVKGLSYNCPKVDLKNIFALPDTRRPDHSQQGRHLDEAITNAKKAPCNGCIRIDDFKQTHLKNIGKIQEIKNNILYIKDHGLNTHPPVKGEEPYNLPRDIYVVIKGATDNNSRINGIYNNIKI